MSLRTSLRVVSRTRAVPSARAVVPRRFASSQSSHKPSSDLPWMIGSVGIFGGLGAFILMPSATKDHVAHQQHPHEPKQPGGAQLTAQELTDNVKNHKVEELAKKSEGDFRSEELDEAKKEGRETTNPPKAVAQGDKKAPGEDENVGGEDDGSPAEKSTSNESGDEPSQKEIMQSIRRGEHTDAPSNAEAAESGEQSSPSDGASGDEPTQAEIMSSIRRSEHTDAPANAEADEEKA